ncbi:MAG: hypothetical protein Q9217_006627 [Psora testacea]
MPRRGSVVRSRPCEGSGFYGGPTQGGKRWVLYPSDDLSDSKDQLALALQRAHSAEDEVLRLTLTIEAQETHSQGLGELQELRQTVTCLKTNVQMSVNAFADRLKDDLRRS